jgi:PTH1 family peptidyl-tRNA hydrolase
VDLIVGLGNPGRRYQHTRHNLGFDVIDALAQRCGATLRKHETGAYCGEATLGAHRVLFVKPQSFMNVSGRSVAHLVERYLHPHEQLIVIHDDLDLPLGKIRLKRGGGDAGHRGIRSIIEWIGHGEFARVRMGIGRPACKADIVAYVLSPFTAEEAETYTRMVDDAIQGVETLLNASEVGGGSGQQP